MGVLRLVRVLDGILCIFLNFIPLYFPRSEKNKGIKLRKMQSIPSRTLTRRSTIGHARIVLWWHLWHLVNLTIVLVKLKHIEETAPGNVLVRGEGSLATNVPRACALRDRHFTVL